jgi:hypothetical protein
MLRQMLNKIPADHVGASPLENLELKLMQLMNFYQNMNDRDFKALVNGKYEQDQNGCMKIIQFVYSLQLENDERNKAEKMDAQSLLKSFRESMIFDDSNSIDIPLQISRATEENQISFPQVN